MSSTPWSKGPTMPRTRASSLPAYMRSALALLPIRSLGKSPRTTAVLEPGPEPEVVPLDPQDMAWMQSPPHDERATLQAEIDDLRRRMDALSNELREKQVRLMQLANCIPEESSLTPSPPPPTYEHLSGLPIQKFPPEVLQRIFHHVIQADPTSQLALTQVCFYWRTCAFSCPPLWSEITIPIRSSYTAGFVNTVTLSFQRAKASALHLRMTYELGDSFGADPSSSTGPDFRLLDLALSRQHLWSTLEVDLRDQVWTASMLDRLADALDGAHCPRLKSIGWKTGMKNSPRFELILARLLAAADTLESLSIQSHVDLPVPMPKPMSELRSLTIQQGRRPPVAQLLPFLQALPALEELTLPSLDYDTITPTSPLPPQPVHLPALQRFDFEASDDMCDAAFLQQLTLPSIQKLTLRSTESLELSSSSLAWRVAEEKGWPLERVPFFEWARW